jgi:outer membrane protein assembly factor BamB
MFEEHSLNTKMSLEMVYVRLLIFTIIFSQHALCRIKADDYPQWRGPDRNGVARGGEIGEEVWSKTELPVLWHNEEIPGSGYSSVSVCNGRAYTFCVAQYSVPLVERTLDENGLKRLGWFDETIPPNLFRELETDRISPARLALKGKELNEWIEHWIAERISSEEEKKRLGRIISDRLRRGKDALPLEVLKKLETIKDRVFSTQNELDKWLAENGISEEVNKVVLRAIPTSERKANDVVFCLDDGTGEILWRTAYPVENKGSDASSTVCIANGRCYVAGSNGDLYCLNAETGKEIWQTRMTKGTDAVHSSPLCANGIVSVLADHLVGVRTADGEILWRQEDIRGRENSPVKWADDDNQVYVICNTNRDIGCVKVETGELVWAVPGGGRSTVAVSGNHMAIFSSRDELGLALYNLSTNPPERLWSNAEYTDGGASPLISAGRVYALGNERALCADISTGAIVWDAEVGGKGYSSPVIYGGVMIAIVGKDVLALDTEGDEYTLLAKWGLSSLQYTSPALINGRLFLRKKEGLFCYRL